MPTRKRQRQRLNRERLAMRRKLRSEAYDFNRCYFGPAGQVLHPLYGETIAEAMQRTNQPVIKSREHA